MRRGVLVAILAVLAALGVPAARGDDPATLTGTVALADAGVLPADAVLTVTLEDVARADAPAVTLAQTTIDLTGQQPPIAFALNYFRGAIAAHGSYAVRARVSSGERLLFTTTERHQVDPADPAPVHLLLSAVSGGAVSGGGVPLTETYWKLLDVDGAPIQTAETMSEPSLVLHDQDSRLSGSGGVNRLIGGYTLQSEALSFAQVASTMMAGPPAAMAQEQTIVAALGRVRGFAVDGDRLALLDGSGRPVLTAVAAAPR